MERTIGYIYNGSANLETYGASVISGKDKSTKYATVYPYSDVGNNDNEKGESNYILNDKIYGDSIRETSESGKGTTSWNNGYSYFPGGDPFFGRGGLYGDGNNADLSPFGRGNGNAHWTYGFRSVLV